MITNLKTKDIFEQPCDIVGFFVDLEPIKNYDPSFKLLGKKICLYGGWYKVQYSNEIILRNILKKVLIGYEWILKDDNLFILQYDKQQFVNFGLCYNEDFYKASQGLNSCVLFGYNYQGSVFKKLTETQHILVSGATGSGKSVALKCIIDSLLLNRKAKQFFLFDLKGGIELKEYQNIYGVYNNHIFKEPRESAHMLNRIHKTMRLRFKDMERRGINKWDGTEYYIIIDELADLVMSKYHDQVINVLIKLSQLARACGIYLIVATQKPLISVLPSLFLANLNTRLVLKVSSVRDSVLVLDHKGAETLKGNGDAILKCGAEEMRLQVPFISKEENKKLVECFIKW